MKGKRGDEVSNFAGQILWLLAAIVIGIAVWALFLFMTNNTLVVQKSLAFRTELAMDGLTPTAAQLSSTGYIRIPVAKAKYMKRLDKDDVYFSINVTDGTVIAAEEKGIYAYGTDLMFSNLMHPPEGKLGGLRIVPFYLYQQGKKFSWDKDGHPIPQTHLPCPDVPEHEEIRTYPATANAENDDLSKTLIDAFSDTPMHADRAYDLDGTEFLVMFDHVDRDGAVVIYAKEAYAEACALLNAMAENRAVKSGTVLSMDGLLTRDRESLDILKGYKGDGIYIELPKDYLKSRFSDAAIAALEVDDGRG